MKTCTLCKIEQPLSLYQKNKKTISGLHTKCKPCMKKQRQKYKETNSDKLSTYMREYYQKNKEKLSEINKLYYINNKSDCLARNADWTAQNQDKVKEYKQSYYTENRFAILEEQKAYYQANKEKVYHTNKRWREKNKLKVNAYSRAYTKRHPGRRNARTAFRRARLHQATPGWLTKNDRMWINWFYRHSKKLEEVTGIKYHVDHIEPLNGKRSSGLHVPWNLQVIPAKENLSKSNNLLEVIKESLK